MQIMDIRYRNYDCMKKACFEIFKKISFLDKKNQIKKRLRSKVKTMDFGRLN